MSVLNGTDPEHCDILCLQELPVHVERFASFRFRHWNLILPSNTGTAGSSGHIRSAIYVSNRLPSDSYSQIPLKTLDICAVKFSFSSDSFCIFSVYNPPSSHSSIDDLAAALRDCDPAQQLILAGDFNLHHPLWSGPNAPDRMRRSDAEPLLQLLASQNLSLALPPGTPTFRSDSHRSWSTLDLVFVSSSLLSNVTRCETAYGHGSDHRCIELEVDLSVPLRTEESGRRTWRDTDWEQFTGTAETLWSVKQMDERSRTLDSTSDIDTLVHDITDIFAQAAEEAVPCSRPCPHSKRWWSPELTALKRTARRLSNRAAKRSAPPDTIEAAREADRDYHRAIRRQKRHHWREYVESATEQTLWQASKYVTQAPDNISASRLPELKLADGSVARTRSEKRDALMAQFFPLPPAAAVDDIADATYDQQIPHVAFTEEDIHAALQNVAPYKAPGPSGIPNAALKQCASFIAHGFTNVTNRCIELGYHPTEWKNFTTITLRKPGKPSYAVPKAYRPIALEDTSSKLVESVVARSLANIAEEQGLLPPNHFGGRPNRCTTDAVLHLTQRIKDSWRKGHVASVLYLDISSAFPSVNHARLLHNLRKRRVPEPLVRWVADFLKDRRTQLKFDDFTSEPLTADCGIPQGSPLSPILYLFYSADLLEIVDPKDKSRLSFGYIDDTSLVVTSPSVRTNITMLEELVPKLLDWSRRHACKFDIAKFQLVHYTRWKPRYQALALRIGSHMVEPTSSAKYLGIVLDQELRWHQQVDDAVAKGMAATLAISRLSRPTFGLPHTYARRLIVAIVCSKMEHGIAVWYTPVVRPERGRATGSIGFARRMGKVQRLAALVITGAFRSTSTVALDYHAGLMPVELRLNLAVFKAVLRIASLPQDHPLHPAFRKCATQYPHFHRTQLHEALHAFPELKGVAATDPTPVDSPALTVETPGDKASAIARIHAAMDGRELCVYTHGDPDADTAQVGVAALAVTRSGEVVTRRAGLGDPRHRHPRDTALAAVALAIEVVAGCPRATKISILIRDRAAVSVMSRLDRPHPLVRLAYERAAALRTKRRSLRVSILWAPKGAGDLDLVDRVREEARAAMRGLFTPLPRAMRAMQELPVDGMGDSC